MRSLARLFILGVLALTLNQAHADAAAQPARDRSAQRVPPFRAALEAHLNAVASGNLDALLPTLTHGNDLVLILPDGKKLDTRQQFVDLHREWFASKDEWQW